MTRLVLASASPYRKQLLQRLGIPFITSAQDIDESRHEGEKPEAMVYRLAYQKANSCLNKYSTSVVVIGGDQIGVLGSRILSKPGNHENAVNQLQLCSRQKVTFLTAVCLLNSDTGHEYRFTDVTEVQFRELGKRQIESYVNRERPFGSCGSFQIEGLGISLVTSVRSDDPTALTGLPLIRISAYLSEHGLML